MSESQLFAGTVAPAPARSRVGGESQRGRGRFRVVRARTWRRPARAVDSDGPGRPRYHQAPSTSAKITASATGRALRSTARNGESTSTVPTVITTKVTYAQSSEETRLSKRALSARKPALRHGRKSKSPATTAPSLARMVGAQSESRQAGREPNGSGARVAISRTKVVETAGSDGIPRPRAARDP